MLEQGIQASLWQERLVALLSAFFGAVSLILSGIGLYAVLAYSVAERRRELGIRIAVGAGLFVGLAAAAALLAFTRALLYGVTPGGIGSYAIAVCTLLICALSATALPTWRAVRTDPALTLREE